MIRSMINALFSADNGGDDATRVLSKGIVGFIASAAPIAASKSGMLHSILEIAALGLGVVVSFLTAVSLAFTVERKIRARIDEWKNPGTSKKSDDSLRD